MFYCEVKMECDREEYTHTVHCTKMYKHCLTGNIYIYIYNISNCVMGSVIYELVEFQPLWFAVNENFTEVILTREWNFSLAAKFICYRLWRNAMHYHRLHKFVSFRIHLKSVMGKWSVVLRCLYKVSWKYIGSNVTGRREAHANISLPFCVDKKIRQNTCLFCLSNPLKPRMNALWPFV